MSLIAAAEREIALAPFDELAEQYDEMFTNSLVGRAQRAVIWGMLSQTFEEGDSVLELNCGTGEDALFLAKSGVAVSALDISAQMIAVANRRKAQEAPEATVSFTVMETERLHELADTERFDGAFSNFSGLNCVRDLGGVARALSTLIRPGGHVLLCLSSKLCAWEAAWFLLNRNPRRAFRRLSRGGCVARLGKSSIHVWYPSIREVREVFHPWFSLKRTTGVGIFVPPSYLEKYARRVPRLFQCATSLDEIVREMPLLRSIGDHILLDFCRSAL